MKAGNKNNMQQSSSIIQQVLNLFQELNKVQAVSKSQIFQLIKIFRSHPTNFQQAWELAYLKILKIFHEKGNRKMPPKYENLATTFFTELMPKDGHPDGASTTFFDNFLEFLSEAVFSTLAGIRITAARMLFHLLKGCGAFTGQKAKQKLLKSVFFLVRLRVSTYKQIGIKLASIVLGWKGIIQKKVEEEFFKIMAVEENQQIRKMAMTNIWINKQNLDKVLIRLRDKCTDIRSIILRKLTGERFPLQNTELTHRFHLLYDGFGNKESSVQQDTLKYFLLFFEQPKYECFVQFVKLFQPQVLLSQPQLYSLFDLLLIEIVQEIPLSDVQEFVRKLCGDLRNFAKGNRTEVPKELIWLKALAKSENVELKALFEEQIPSGMELAKLLLELIHSKNAFCIHQCVQIFRLYKSADELGRNKMFEALKALVGGIDLWHIQTPQLVDAKSDICSALTPLQIKQKKLLLSYFDLPPITSSFDLIIEVGQAMKAIWPDHYEIQLKQLMSDWNNPEQNTLLKQKELAQANIKKAQTKNDSQIVASLRAKLKSIEGELESQIAKTKIVITTIMRLRPTASMEDYMSIVKQELSNKEDQSQGLVLLGLYCLQERDRAESFLPLYWAHINKEQSQKLHLLVSLRVLTDIFVKFDFHSLQLSALNQSKSTDQFQYSAFINKMLKFVLNTDPDIRMVAIQGLCRLVFHNRVNQERVVSCFMRLLLLWWETSSQEVSARSVHTISVFIKQFLQKGQNQVRKISEFLCIFFKMLIICQSKGQSISKYKIVYNLKMQEFVKRSVVIAMTVLKYHKQSRQVIWKYQENGAQLGPQQLLLLFLLKESKLHFCLQKAINICDFYEDAPLETLILVKKHLETFIEQTSFQSSKKLELMLKKLESDIEDRIQIKNRETFNQQLLNGLKQQLHEYQLLIQTSGTAVADELAIEEIVIQNKQTQEQSQFQDFSQQLEDPLPQELQGLEQDPFSLNQSKKPNSTLLHNRQNKVNQKANQKVQNIESDEAISNQQQVRGRKKGGKGLGETNKNRGQRNRKRQASPLQDDQSAEMQKEKIISSRTRSKVQL